ncbi:MAG: hypothetical protein GX638_03955 [Crenarchaeota archaeon]|nr:hypothetical protein [Thermoproteota archaeon]
MKRFLKNQRGQIRVIEAFFAAMLMLSILTILPAIENSTSHPEGTLSENAKNILISLDGEGQVANLIEQRNWNELRSLFQSCVSLTLWFNVTVFDEDMKALNEENINNGSPIGNNIESAEYICVSISSEYTIYIVRLQLGGLN